MNRKIISISIALLIIVGAVFLSSFIIKNKEVPKMDMTKKNILYVKTALAQTQNVTSQAVYRGRVSSLENVSLATEVSGKILQGNVPLKEGQTFQKGDLLVQIYDENAQASIRSLRSTYLQLISSVLPDIKLDFPEEFSKWNTFFNSIDIEAEIPKLPEVNSEKERVFLASRNLLSQYYSIKQQEIILKKYKLYAPFQGTYTQVNAEVGSIASMNMTIAKIIRTDIMEVVVPVLPEDVGWMYVGMNVEMTRSNGSKIDGKISRIAGFIDESSQSVNVYVSVKNSGPVSLLGNEYVDAVFSSSKTTSGIEVPREAVMKESMMFVLKDSTLQIRNIEILKRFEDSFVVSGYEEGEILVMESLVDVEPGQLAAPVK